MSDTTQRHPVTLKRVVYEIPGMEHVRVTRGVEYGISDAGPLVMDVYHPRATEGGEIAPVVVLVTGYPDTGIVTPLGCAFKDMEMSISLAQLIASSGMAAIVYTTRDPAVDVFAALAHMRGNADRLRFDAGRIGLWALSGNVPVALSVLTRHDLVGIRAAVLSCGFTFDAEGSAVADAARTYRFVDAGAGKSVSEIRSDLALFIARAGRDEFPGLNRKTVQHGASEPRRSNR
jgi:hypothetical protein